MRISTSGRAPWRVIIIQLFVLTGLAIFFKIYLPHHTRDMVAQAAATREEKINELFKDAVFDDSTHEISVPLQGDIVKRHPQRLRIALSPQGAESTLGAPDKSTVDFQGGQHLTWVGTTHILEGAFNSGRLYCLKLEDRSTGHGVMVFESIYAWHPY
jgi:hypothetical protein